MASLGGAVSGAGTGAALGSFLPGIGTGIGAGVGALGGFLFGRRKPKDASQTEISPYTDALQASSERLQGQAGELSGMGGEALAPALKYFASLLSGNPADLMEATRPERGRVIDQYDTARQAIGQFGPRGGGTTSALAQSRISEAGDLADVTAQARRGAAETSAGLGQSLTALGLSAEQLASADLNSIISAVLNKQGLDLSKRGQNLQAMTGLGESLGALLGLFLTREGGAWGPKPKTT